MRRQLLRISLALTRRLTFAAWPIVSACNPPPQSQEREASEGDSAAADDGGDHDSGPSNKSDSGDSQASWTAGSSGNPDDAGDSGNTSGADTSNTSTTADHSGETGPLPCSVDFLFVIDNSMSMADEQANLATSVPAFIEALRAAPTLNSDFHIGVVTTAPYEPTAATCQNLGGMVTATAGDESSNADCGPYASGANYMDQNDDIDQTFACAARPGTWPMAGDEKPIRAMLEALSGPPATDCNSGFLRPESLLVIVLLTDEEDDDETLFDPPGSLGSGGEPPEWYEDLVAVKSQGRQQIVVVSIIGTPEDNECVELFEPGDPDHGLPGIEGAVISRRLIKFTEMFGTHGLVGDVCAPDYGPIFDKALTVVEAACG